MDTPTPTGSWYDRFRKGDDQRSFRVAFLVSGILHLSVVTVFSVVIYFPREDTRYYNFEIVPLRASASEESLVQPTEEPLVSTEGGDKLALRGTGYRSNKLPEIELPTLEFAELERLRVGQSGTQSLSRYDELFRPEATDSWARFSRGLSGMSRSLSQLRLSGDEGGPDAASVLGADTPMVAPITHRPAEGFEAQLVWSSEPYDRKLLFSPPIEALWGVDEEALQRPLELVLQVNATGRVVNVFSPSLDDRELVDAVQMTALRYRFEPLGLEDGAEQTVTLRIRRETSGVVR